MRFRWIISYTSSSAQSDDRNSQLDPPPKRVCFGGDGKLSTTNLASCDRWTMTSLSLTAVCIRRTFSTSGSCRVSFLLLGAGVGRCWSTRSEDVGLAGGASTETVGITIELFWMEFSAAGKASAEGVTAAAGSAGCSTLTSFKPSASVWCWTLASSWKRTLTLCRCWSTTACTWTNMF